MHGRRGGRAHAADRQPTASATRRRLGSRSYCTTVTLRSLSEADTQAMASQMLGMAQCPAELTAALMEKAEGVPLFIEEVTKAMLDLGVLQRDNGGYRLVRSIADVDIPDTIEGIIMARIDRLGESGKRTVQLASVIGRHFLKRLLERVAELPGQLEGLLAELKRLEIIYEQGLLPEPAYVFKHAVIQDVAYKQPAAAAPQGAASGGRPCDRGAVRRPAGRTLRRARAPLRPGRAVGQGARVCAARRRPGRACRTPTARRRATMPRAAGRRAAAAADRSRRARRAARQARRGADHARRVRRRHRALRARPGAGARRAATAAPSSRSLLGLADAVLRLSPSEGAQACCEQAHEIACELRRCGAQADLPGHPARYSSPRGTGRLPRRGAPRGPRSSSPSRSRIRRCARAR